MDSFYLFVPFNSGREVFFGMLSISCCWKILVGDIFNFCCCFKHSFLMGFDGSWSWVHPKCARFFSLFLVGFYFSKRLSNLLLLTPQIFDKQWPGTSRISRLQVKTCWCASAVCCEALAGSALDAYLLSGGSCSSVATDKNWVKDWTRHTLHS